MIENIETARRLINEANNIILTGHIRPDGDAVGSTLAMAYYLRTLGKRTTVVYPNAYPEFFNWIPGIKDTVIFEDQPDVATRLIRESDLHICLDYNQMSRISAIRPIVDAHKTPKMVIDHHLGLEIEADFVLSDPEAAATCQLVFKFIKALSGAEVIDRQLAEYLMIGITTDTGNTAFSANDPELYYIIGDLIATGIDKTELYNHLFHTYTADRFKLMSYLMSKMELLNDGKTALVVLTQADMRKYNYKNGDSEGFVNMPLQISKVTRSILVREEKNQINVSLRSVGDVPVNKIAELFGGGGHKNAAGCEFDVPLKEALERLKRVL